MSVTCAIPYLSHHLYWKLTIRLFTTRVRLISRFAKVMQNAHETQRPVGFKCKWTIPKIHHWSNTCLYTLSSPKGIFEQTNEEQEHRAKNTVLRNMRRKGNYNIQHESTYEEISLRKCLIPLYVATHWMQNQNLIIFYYYLLFWHM